MTLGKVSHHLHIPYLTSAAAGAIGSSSSQAAGRLSSPRKLIQSSTLQSINYWPICFRNIKRTFINCPFHSMLQNKDLGAFRCLSYLKPQQESIIPQPFGREHHCGGRVGWTVPPIPIPVPVPSLLAPDNAVSQSQPQAFSKRKGQW